MNNLAIAVFDNPEFGNVRTITELDGKVLFCATDVANGLGYSNPRDAIARHCRYVVKHDVPHPQSPDKTIEMTYIPEGDVYRLLAHSKMPKAEEFGCWLFDEVVPSIRRNGGYIVGQKTLSDMDLMARALKVAERCIEERDAANAELKLENHALASKTEVLKCAIEEQAATIKAQAATIGEQIDMITEMRPKAAYCDIILANDGVVPLRIFAQDYGFTAQMMNSLLHELHIQYQDGKHWYLYSRYTGRGYTQSKTELVDGEPPRAEVITGWTQEGRFFLYHKLKSNGILPLIEQERDPNLFNA